MNELVVSICCIAYKHEAFIAETINSIVRQKTNFKFKLIIGEDKSPDGTRSICEEYAAKYPDLIELLPSDKNYGMMGNFIRTLQACKGKYTAVCEGDDYWIDDHKLQRQVDFLEQNPEFSLCFSDIATINADGSEHPRTFPEWTKDVVTIEDVVRCGYVFIPTATLLFRNILPSPMPDFYYKAISGDIGLHLMLLDKGKGKMIPGKTAVYRMHPGGITKSKDHQEQALIKQYELYEDTNKYLEYRYDTLFREQLFKMSKTILIYGSKDKGWAERLGRIKKYLPWYFKYQPSVNVKEVGYVVTLLLFPSLLKIKK